MVSDRSEKLYRELRGGTDPRTLIAVLIFLVSVLLFASYSASSPETSLVLTGEADLDRIDDNTLGTVIVRNDGLPRLYSRPGLDTCIYTSANSSPLLVKTDGIENRYIAPKEVETFRINFSIPREELGRSGLQNNFSVERRDHCPIRSGPKIVVKE